MCRPDDYPPYWPLPQSDARAFLPDRPIIPDYRDDPPPGIGVVLDVAVSAPLICATCDHPAHEGRWCYAPVLASAGGCACDAAATIHEATCVLRCERVCEGWHECRTCEPDDAESYISPFDDADAIEARHARNELVRSLEGGYASPDDFDPSRCDRCGERFTENDERAEVVARHQWRESPSETPVSEHLIIHQPCMTDDDVVA